MRIINKFAFAFAGLMMMFSTQAMADESVASAPAPTVAPAAGSNADAYIKDINDLAGATRMLEQVDRNHSPFSDQTIETNMVLNGGSHHDVTYTFTTYSKGGDKRSVRFHSPADMRGMGVVTKGRDEVYARLPDSNKVRRVGTHSKRQSFYGSDWAMDDMTMINMAQDYDIVKILDLKADNNTHVKLELKLKPTTDLPYPNVVIKVDKQRLLMDFIEYYGENGKLIKTQYRDTLKDLGNGYELYTHITVIDAATQHKTENNVLSEKINQNIPDETFTKRWLVRSI